MNEEDNRKSEDAKDLLRRAEETGRKLEFIAQQRAQFAADMQQARKEQEERWLREDERWADIEERIRALLKKAQGRRGENGGAGADA